MKKFAWRLQRLLDIQQKKEQVQRNELFTLTEETVAVRSRMMMLKTQLRTRMAEIQELSGPQRLEHQAMFLEHVSVRDREITGLAAQWKELEKRRKEKMNQILQTRKFRKGLERLRSKAYSEYMQRMNQEEQKNLDDNVHTGLMRKKQLSACPSTHKHPK